MRKTFAMGIILILVFVFTFLAAGYSEAAMPPAPFFCERNGYSMSEDGKFCDFDDGNSCDIWEFHSGECGEEYRKDSMPCVEEGEPVFHFDECCEGHEPSMMGCGTVMIIGQPHCRKSPDMFQRFWEWFNCFFFGVI